MSGKVHMHKSTFGYAVAINGVTMPMDVPYSEAIEWCERLEACGLEYGGPIPPPGEGDDPYDPLGNFAKDWKATERWTMRSGPAGLTLLQGPVGVNQIARLFEHAINLARKGNG